MVTRAARLTAALFVSGLASLTWGLVGGCSGGGPETTTGAGGTTTTGTSSGPFMVGPIDGPKVAYLGEEVCFEITQTGGPQATVEWSFGDDPPEPAKVGAEKACHTW